MSDTATTTPSSSRAHPAPNIVIIGAGPAGLTAAYELTKKGCPSTVLEADNVVGGISRTAMRDGWRFDIGGHRFFTKVKPVETLWDEILGEEMLLRPRKSRIYYRGKFIDYPIRPLNALRNLGLVEAIWSMFSFLWVRVRPPKDQSTLEGYIVANYGWRLYQHLFKTYSEKVWAVPASEISADWGAQRIKGMTLWQAVWEPFRARVAGSRKDKTKQVTSLIEQFKYPRHGPGMMWERCHELVEAAGTKVIFEAPVARIRHEGGRATSVVAETDGGQTEYPADHVISSMPFSQLLQAMDPPVPPEVQRAADGLGFRDFLSIALVVPADKVPWTDNWIYIHDPEVKTMRVQNFGSWSPHMVKDGRNVLGLEYTVTEGDERWTASDDDLIERGKAELQRMGLVDAGDVEAGYVVRMPKAYPVYDDAYQANVAVLREWLDANAPNVHPVGRNGMHKYNNQDHSMFTAMLTVENILDGADHDVWSVNVEEEYHEESSSAADGSRGDGASGGSAAQVGGRSGGSTGRDAPILPRRGA